MWKVANLIRSKISLQFVSSSFFLNPTSQLLYYLFYLGQMYLDLHCIIIDYFKTSTKKIPSWSHPPVPNKQPSLLNAKQMKFSKGNTCKIMATLIKINWEEAFHQDACMHLLNSWKDILWPHAGSESREWAANSRYKGATDWSAATSDMNGGVIPCKGVIMSTIFILVFTQCGSWK